MIERVPLPVAILSVLGVCGYGAASMLTLPSADRPLLMRSAPFGQASVAQLLGPEVWVPTIPTLGPDEGAFDASAVIRDKEVHGTWKPVRAGFPPLTMFGGAPGTFVAPPVEMPQPYLPPWQWPSADQFYNVTPPPQQQASPR